MNLKKCYKNFKKQRRKSCLWLIVMTVFDLGIKYVKKVGGSVKLFVIKTFLKIKTNIYID